MRQDTHIGLWLFALSAQLADVVTTWLALSFTPATEGGPVAAAALAASGIPGLVALKIVGVAAALVCWLPVRRRWAVPVWVLPGAVTLSGAGLASWNLTGVLLT